MKTKVYSIVTDWATEDDRAIEVSKQSFTKKEDAIKELNSIVNGFFEEDCGWEKEVIDRENRVVTDDDYCLDWHEDLFEVYRDGWYDTMHTLVYIVEQELV